MTQLILKYSSFYPVSIFLKNFQYKTFRDFLTHNNLGFYYMIDYCDKSNTRLSFTVKIISSYHCWLKCLLRRRWQNGIVLFLYMLVLAKLTLNNSVCLTLYTGLFSWIGKSLMFLGCWIHFLEKSKHLFNLLLRKVSKPVISNDDEYPTYMSPRITFKHVF